jgi:hypothetical protein
MSRARDVASLLNTVATDAEVSDAVAAVPTGRKNLLYNGAMQVAQRGTSVAGITGTSWNTADRWWTLGPTGFGTFTQSVESDSPDGFGKSLKMLCTTAEASPAADKYLTILQQLEGQDLQGIAKGTSSAKPLTLSFWVKSNVTGTYSVMLYDNDNARFVSFAYSVDASATWEKKTILVPADTTGAFDNDNASSLQVYFNLVSGSTYTGGSAQNTWSSGTAFGSQWMPSQTNLAAATNNYWQITGVQLEVGDTATDFEHKPFGVELADCQRYYFKTFNQETKPAQAAGNAGSLGGSSAVTNVSFVSTQTLPVAMRSAPSVITYQTDGASSNWGSQGGAVPTATILGWSGNSQVSIRASGSILAGGVHAIHLTADAEL